MSKRRTDGVMDTIYAPFMNNPAQNTMGVNQRMYVRILSELAINRFKWTGLPDTVDERFLEMTLFYRGLAIFYYDKEFDRYMALRGTGAGRINMYDNPTSFRVIGNTMVNKTLSSKDCVPIWGNATRIPDWDIVTLYARKLADIDRTIDINILSQRHSHIVLADELDRLTYVNLLRQHQEGQPVIFGTKNLDMSKVQVFDVGVDKDVIPNLQVVKTRMWNECMTLLGINNANQDKRERLVADEVSANDDQIVAMRGVSLNSRKRAAYEINRMFADKGMSIGVGWNDQAGAAATGIPEVQ